MAMVDEEVDLLKIDWIGVFPNKKGVQCQVKVVFASWEHKQKVAIHAKNLANFNKTRKPPMRDDLTRKQCQEKREKFAKKNYCN
uniref:Uncharacterized protein n=1 Tax=Romanomermis culicivorax TaxID=13658 RepID=A0A915IKX2_ROMCU